MRRKDREITDPAVIAELLKSVKVMHLGIHDDPYPYVVPMHYGCCTEDGKTVLYAHGASEGFKYELLAKNAYVMAEIDTGAEEVPGGDIPCAYGARYASVMIRGRAEILEDIPAKIKGLEVLMKAQTGREFTITPEMTEKVNVIRIAAEQITAKSRA